MVVSKRKFKKLRTKSAGLVAKQARVGPVAQIATDEQRERERRCEIFFVAALFGFGVYQSILYFGHTVVPVSDFPDLYQVGRDILSFRLPARFKQAPVLGMLQVALSYVVGGGDPNLKAGWLLNALLHPFNLVLLYLVGKQIVGKAALWLAVVAILNPWVVYLLTEPIVETTYMFFILLTFYLMFRRSKWCYLAASITTMVRYEGASLILMAFVLDMIDATERRRRINAFIYSALACIPLGLWMLGTYLTWSPNTTHYFNVWGKGYGKSFKESVANRTGIGMHLQLLWHVGFRSLLTTATEIKTTFRMIQPTAATAQSIQSLYTASKVIIVLGAGFGTIYGLAKRNWKMVALLIFSVPYFLVHASYPYPLQRFHTTIFWIALLLFWFGVQSIWNLINDGGRVPRAVASVLQGAVGVIALIWLIVLFPYLGKVSSISPTSASVPYVAIALVVVLFAVRIYIYKLKCLPREIAIVSLLAMVIVSNQFRLVPLVNDGQKEAEFKNLADWYVANARPGEKMGVYMASVVGMFAPDHAEHIVRLPGAETPSEFVQACYEQDITYVVWATREGLGQHHTGYKQLGLDKNIAVLRGGRSIGPYEFTARVGAKRGYVNIFRVRKPPVPVPES